MNKCKYYNLEYLYGTVISLCCVIIKDMTYMCLISVNNRKDIEHIIISVSQTVNINRKRCIK